MPRIAVIGNKGQTLVHFRGPLIHDLVCAGADVFALAPHFTTGHHAALTRLGATPVDISLHRTGLSPGRDLLDIWRLVRLFRRIRPDAVLAYFAKPIIYGSLAARLARIPACYSLIAGLGYAFADENPLAVRRRALRFLVARLYKMALARNNRVFFQNPEDQREFLRLGIVRPEQAVRVNGTGVDLDHYSFYPPVREPITFLLAARLIEEKGIREFASAARNVRARWSDIRFVLLGGRDDNPSALTESEVRGWVQEGAIEWPGEVADVRPWLARTSVYVLPSYYREGVPRSTQEAMAMGRSVITTDSTGCRETVQDGINGFLVPVRDPDRLAEAMIRFIDAPELIDQMGRESRRIAEEKFDVREINAVIMREMGIEVTNLVRK